MTRSRPHHVSRTGWCSPAALDNVKLAAQPCHLLNQCCLVLNKKVLLAFKRPSAVSCTLAQISIVVALCGSQHNQLDDSNMLQMKQTCLWKAYKTVERVLSCERRFCIASRSACSQCMFSDGKVKTGRNRKAGRMMCNLALVGM